MPAPKCALARGRDTIYGSMRMLADNRDEAFELLRLAIQEPRFDTGADRPHPGADGVRHRRRAAGSRNRGPDQMGAGPLWRPSLCPPGRRHRGVACRASPQPISTPCIEALFARDKLHVAHGRRDRCRDGEASSSTGCSAACPKRPRLRPVAHVGWKLGQKLDGDLPAAADHACSSPIPGSTATTRSSSPPI